MNYGVNSRVLRLRLPLLKLKPPFQTALLKYTHRDRYIWHHFYDPQCQPKCYKGQDLRDTIYIYIRMCAYLLIIFLSISIPISIHLLFHIAIYLYKYLYIYVSLYIYIKMRVCVFHEELDSHPLGRWPILRAWRIPAMRGRSWWSPIHW
jgi:hypothetical protein